MTKLYIPLFLILLSPFACISVLAQNITASFASTPSICFNDGTLTVNAAGGTTPYTDTITSGPTDPNITYPIVLPSGQNTFVNLPHGTYTVVVTDAAGHTGTFTTSVGGTYQFPTMTVTSTASGVIATASFGLPPYQYALSSTGSNSGFGAYQSADSFNGLCPGQYWVRMRDSCQNIYTVQTAVATYVVGYAIQCINYSKGFFYALASGGHAPYTFSFYPAGYPTIVNNTGTFTGLPPYFSGTLVIQDSCGVSRIVYLIQEPVLLFQNCPLDGILYIDDYSNYAPYTFVCADCNPAQTVSGSSLALGQHDPLFINTQPNQSYNIFVLTPACGGDTIHPQVYPPASGTFSVNAIPLSCNSFQIGANGSFDSVVLRNSSGTIVAVNHTGTFSHLPDDSYTATAYTDSASNICYYGDSASTSFNVPYFPLGCDHIMMDSSCNKKWEFSLGANFTGETYSLIYSYGDTIKAVISPPPTLQYYFYNIDSGVYTLISDSGCSEIVTLGDVPAFIISTNSSVSCSGQSTVNVNLFASNNTLCGFYDLALYKNNNLVGDTFINFLYYNNTSFVFQANDTGWYEVKFFAEYSDPIPGYLSYDQFCPLDSSAVYVTNSHIPYPFPNSAYICGANGTDTPYYHIYGGQIPYTVEIPGYDTVTLTTNTGIFPTRVPGQYGMIVYDDCGISRSITFGIRDTCDGCPIAGMTMPDTLYCSGDTVYLNSTSIGAIAYQWLVNGTAYSTSRDTFFLPDVAGSYDLMLRAYSRSGCIDSATARFDIGSSFSFDLGVDTNYCDTFRRVLYTGIPSTIWSTGDIGPQITVSIEGQYWAVATGRCGVTSDTILILSPAILGLYLSADHPSICIDRADSVLLFASDTLGSSAHTYAWSTGQTDSVVYSSSVMVYTPGPYTVTVSDGQCLRVRSDTIATRLCDSTSCAQASIGTTDSLYCTGDTIHLHSTSLGAVSYQWRVNGALYSIAADTVMIAVTGVYDVYLYVYNGSGCGDSAHIHFTVSDRSVISLGADTVYCDSFSRVLYTGISSTTWSTGQVGSQITIHVPGTYSALVASRCGVSSDTVTIRSFAISGLNISSSGTTVCTDQPDSVALRATVDSLTQPRVTFVWSSGRADSMAYSSVINAHTPGSYQVNVSDSFCVVSKSQSIDSAVCDSGSCIYKIAIPDIFSPNGDGKNELFYVLHKCPVYSFLIHIYNRWGELVYESTDIDKGWDGTYRGTPQPQDDYEWFICIRESVTSANNCSNGKLTLIR